MHAPVGQLGLESNAPLSEVTLWIDWPLLTQVTVVPVATVTVAGENAKSTMETLLVAAEPGGGTGWKGSLTGGVGGVVVEVDDAVATGAVTRGVVTNGVVAGSVAVVVP